MVERVAIRRGLYYDSVRLMRIAQELSRQEDVMNAAVVMATPLNITLLEREGFRIDGIDEVGPNDLVTAIRARTAGGVETALRACEYLLESRGADEALPPNVGLKSVKAAKRARNCLNVAFISVAGRYAPYEAASAVEAGLHVFCFSNGFTLRQEAVLKREAIDRGLLFMGPDCGTAIIDGIGLGFANVVDRGPVGIVGASGTGMQSATCLLDEAGIGVSHAIGVGGRDLNAEVNGLMTKHALQLLEHDESTRAILVVSKPPDPQVAKAVARAASRIRKPVVLAFLGSGGLINGEGWYATTVEDAVTAVAKHVGGSAVRSFSGEDHVPVTGGAIRGLFCGGSLCYEAMELVSAEVGRVSSNSPLRPDWLLSEFERSTGHTFIDFGEESLTQGRAHPIIDPSIRLERFEREAADRETGVILVDVILGYGAHPDPASDLAPAIRRVRRRRGATLTVLVCLCGAEKDPQGPREQEQRLRDAGAIVTRSVLRAGRLALAATGSRHK